MATLSSKTGLPSFSQSITEINYFSDGGFERGVNAQTPVGWTQYQDAAAAAPVDGTGGTAVPTVTMLCSNSSPIRGTLSAIITKDAVNRQGVGYAFDFTISPVDKGVTTEVSFEMQTSLNFASGDVVFYVFDVTNSILITPRNTSLTKMDNYGKFFSDFGLTTGTQYRFILHIATVNALAWTLKLDTMVNTTTKAAVPGALVGTWYTPTINSSLFYDATLATNTNITSRVKRTTDSASIQIRVAFTGAANASGGMLFTLPDGIAANTSSELDPYMVNGEAFGFFNNKLYTGIVRLHVSGTQVQVIYNLDAGSTSSSYFWAGSTTAGTNVPAGVALTSGDSLFIRINNLAVSQYSGSGTNLLNQNTQSPIRAGTVQAFAGSVTPAGWLDCDGSAKLIVDYPQLYAQIGTTWATCTNPLTGSAYSAPAAGSFRVPDLRGVFIRGVGTFSDGIGTDTTLAGYQGDQAQGHRHGFSSSAELFESGAGSRSPGSGGSTEFNIVVDPSTDGVNGTPRTGKETRPRNVGLRMIIKAWDESFNLAGFANAAADRNGLVAPRKGQTSLTVTSSLASWVTTRAVGIYYQDQDGNHRLKFNIKGTSAAGGSNVLSLNGVVFKNVVGFNQAVSCLAAGTSPYLASGEVGPNTDDVTIYAATSSSDWRVSGDVELESRPTWA